MAKENKPKIEAEAKSSETELKKKKVEAPKNKVSEKTEPTATSCNVRWWRTDSP